MITIRGSANHATMLQMYRTVWDSGLEVVARGQKTKNVHDMAIVLDSNQPVITSFAARKLNLRYAKQEWMWYLRADRFDRSIEQHATMWQKIRQPDGSYFSNYGQYIFDRSDGVNSQFDRAIETLGRDRNSRRASIVLLRDSHLFESNPDVVCTYAINFTIERSTLHMTVMMRSNDVIFGFTNDAFCFWNLHMFAYVRLLSHHPDLLLGSYTHFTNSMHVYERHYEMIADIIAQDKFGYEFLRVPTPTLDEVVGLCGSRGGYDGPGEYAQWLKA